MKSFRLVSLAAIVLGLALATQASANTVNFTGLSGKTVNGVSVGPYKLQVEGFQGGKTISAACFREDLRITPPKAWTANVFRGDQVPFPKQDPAMAEQWILSQDQLKKGAWLYTQFGTDTTQWSAIHHALWAVFSPPGDAPAPTGNSWYDETQNSAGAWTNVDLANYYVILPSYGPTWSSSGPGGTQDNPWVDYTTIQPFITTPEPASLGLILMGSGLAAVVRRRRRKA